MVSLRQTDGYSLMVLFDIYSQKKARMEETECHHTQKGPISCSVTRLELEPLIRRGSWVPKGRDLAKPQVYAIMVSQKDLQSFTYFNCALEKGEYHDIARIIGPRV